MILRKPYAFLIKHFKLIHLIMTLFMGILVYQTNLLLEFFNEFLSSNQIIIGTNIISSLFNNYVYIFAGATILLALIILILMAFKDKPKLYYILTIIGYSGLIVLYAYSVITIKDMQVRIVDERITRLIRDFLNIAFLFQVYTTLIAAVRSIGLDVKKFNFNKDAQELSVSDSDNEEFEINVEFDSHTLKRTLRRNLRSLKYYFVENKMMLLLLGMLIVFIGSFLIIRETIDKEIIYNINQPFSPVNYNIIISDSYITDKDYRLKKVTSDNNTLVVVKFKIKTPNNTSKFIFGKLALQIGNDKFYHTNEYSSKLTDIGNTYINQNLTNEYDEYLLVYEIPVELKNSSMTLVYTEQIVNGFFGDKVDDIKINIKPSDLDQTNDEEVIGVGQNHIINSGLLDGYEIKINSFDVNDDFRINYNVCVTKTECYNFYELVRPTLSGIKDKAILKLNMNLIENNEMNIESIMGNFGNIEYEVDDVEKTSRIGKLLYPNHKDGFYYFEINEEILEANRIDIVIKVRNNVYRFLLK